MLSIIMPIACSDAQLNSVVARLIKENQNFIREIPCELIIIDSKPNPRNQDSLNIIKYILLEFQVSFKYFETTTVGVGAKFSEGLAFAEGEYVFFMVDELIVMYDFLGDAYDVAKKGFFCGVPYLEAHAFEKSLHPLSYSKYAPVIQVAFGVAPKELYIKIVQGTPSHSLGTTHWSLFAWELNIPIAYINRHVKYCPLIKFDAQRPDVYSPITTSVLLENRKLFAEIWPISRILNIYDFMAKRCENFLLGNDVNIVIVKDPSGGVYVIYNIDDTVLPGYYDFISTVDALQSVFSAVKQNWLKKLLEDTKVRSLFDLPINSSYFNEAQLEKQQLLNPRNWKLQIFFKPLVTFWSSIIKKG